MMTILMKVTTRERKWCRDDFDHDYENHEHGIIEGDADVVVDNDDDIKHVEKKF